MGISGALFAGVSGLNAISTGISVIADNISNVNTVGFKSSTTSFSDLLSQNLKEGVQIGRGSQLQTISQDFAQGSLQLSNNPTNLAIDGDGFFMVNDGSGNFYTRAGEFSLNDTGKLTNPQGMVVQGKKYNQATGILGGSIEDINFQALNSQPKATSVFQIGMNLDSRTVNNGTFRSAVTVHDSLGNPITVTVVLTSSGSGSWTWQASSSLGNITTGSDAGTLTFNPNGVLSSPSGITGDPQINIENIPGSSSLALRWDLVDDISGLSNGSLTGFASNSVVNALTQDGYAPGSLRNLNVNPEGNVTGLFTNGQTQKLFRLELARFTNPSGLTKLGKSILAQSPDSGEPIPGSANQGGFGAISSNALELSNVDLAQEFVNMITAQRGFQANTRVITTVDELLNEVVNLRR